MKNISHSLAVSLEFSLRRIYKCPRGGFAGTIDADVFESDPMLAAYLAFAPVYYNSGIVDDHVDDFINRYFSIFESDDAITDEIEENYIRELDDLIIESYKIF
jgi:hypothetical protein